ncbi:hypothetical protein TSUD_28890 [Trifolium subterraneum]|uniref:DUF659 domain-containing protein n=1 Tax=Trifolium subterraneum TaxID=3900 RepID=A0A2Z6NUH8_TRISU|nr:hypothetical protein TSUD_28890 [Trifolium subterraneum]
MASSSAIPSISETVQLVIARKHQLGIPGEVIACKKTPAKVKVILRADLDEKKKKKQGLEEVEVKLNEDVHSDIAEIRRIRDGKRPADSSLPATSSKASKGPMDLYVMDATIGKESRQTSIQDSSAEKEARARTIQYIARCFYKGGIAFNVTRLNAFKLMVEAIRAYGPHLKPPSYHEMRVPLLQIELEHTKKLLKKHETTRAKFGCTIMSDGWTDRKGRTLMNFLVNSNEGTMFVKSIDATAYTKTGDKLYELLDSFVEEMGDEDRGAVGTKTRVVMVDMVGIRHNRGGKPIDKLRERHNQLWRLRLMSQGLAPRRTDKLKFRMYESRSYVFPGAMGNSKLHAVLDGLDEILVMDDHDCLIKIRQSWLDNRERSTVAV